MPEIYLVVKLGNTDIRYFHGSPAMNEAGYREQVAELNAKLDKSTLRYIMCDDNGDEMSEMVEGLNGKMIPKVDDNFMNPNSKKFDPDAAAHDPDLEERI